MVVCPYCGKENSQPDAAYCLYCGSSLRQAQTPSFTAGGRPASADQGFGGSWGTSSSGMSERYNRALARVELLGNAVVALAVITLILLVILI